MRDVNLAAIDLNLLLVVATVLEERSATRAAQRLHVGQSAVSNALRRARDVFDDPLLVRQPHGLAPTPYGASLLAPLRAWLEEARRLVTRAPAFVPEHATRTFTIASVDAIAITLVPRLLALLRKRAPRATLRVLTIDRLLSGDGLERGEVDLLVGMPPVVPRAHLSELLYRDPLVCLVKRHARRRALTLDRFATLPHVELALFGEPEDAVDQALARHHRARDIAVLLPHFASMPLAVAEIDGVCTLTERVARALSRGLPLEVVRPPIPLGALEMRMVWHQRSERDAALAFLRGLVHEAARVERA